MTFVYLLSAILAIVAGSLLFSSFPIQSPD
jgi:hypothetical protein